MATAAYAVHTSLLRGKMATQQPCLYTQVAKNILIAHGNCTDQHRLIHAQDLLLVQRTNVPVAAQNIPINGDNAAEEEVEDTEDTDKNEYDSSDEEYIEIVTQEWEVLMD